MELTSTTHLPPPVPPATIELTIKLSIEEAKILRAAFGNQFGELTAAFDKALTQVCFFPPEFPDVQMALNLTAEIAEELQEALALTGPCISGVVM